MTKESKDATYKILKSIWLSAVALIVIPVLILFFIVGLPIVATCCLLGNRTWKGFTRDLKGFFKFVVE